MDVGVRGSLQSSAHQNKMFKGGWDPGEPTHTSADISLAYYICLRHSAEEVHGDADWRFIFNIDS